MLNLIEQRFEDFSKIQYRIFLCDISGDTNASALILKFSGVYGHGSLGNDDGHYMRTITLWALNLWLVDAVVYDMRELRYEWGDTIWGLYGRSIEPSGIGDLPYATVVSDLCRTAFKSCESIVGPIFDDLESAIANLRPRAQQYLEDLSG